MGDEADYLIDMILGYDMDDEYYHRADQRQPACNRCGKRNLHWEQIDGKWTLFEKKGLRYSPHRCPVPKDAFEDER
jgi:hypothetical protein